MIENPKMQTYQIKSKPISGFHCFAFFCFMPPCVVLVWSQFGLNSVILAQRCVSPVQRNVLGFSSAVSVWMEVGSCFWVWFWSGRGQMRVSWCQRLDGRMLSTFSMMKFRGANRVLRNCRETNDDSHTNFNLPHQQELRDNTASLQGMTWNILQAAWTSYKKQFMT